MQNASGFDVTDVWAALREVEEDTMLLRLSEPEAIVVLALLMRCPGDKPFSEYARDLAARVASEYFDRWGMPE